MKVIIVGGGFGGIQVALDLANKAPFEVQLISDKNYFEYHAALYRTATGRSPLEVAIPLAELFQDAQNVEIIHDTITDSANSATSTDRTVTGESGSVYHFDTVIFALGNVNNYFHISGLDRFSYGIKTIQEALAFKRHLHESTISGEGAEKNYVIIGAGPTGVELAAELRSYTEKVRKKHGVGTADFNIDLVEAAPRILPAMPEQFARTVAKRLAQLKVTVYTDTKVEKETANDLVLPHSSIQSHTVIWTAGTVNNPLFTKRPQLFPTDNKGKVLVNAFMEAQPGIYVIGDSANTPYSGMAQTALYDAHLVARNLIAAAQGQQLKVYTPKHPAYAIPVGPRWSAVAWKKFTFYGYVGWLLRRLIDLRFYLKFLPLRKALFTWHYGIVTDEECPRCNT